MNDEYYLDYIETRQSFSNSRQKAARRYPARSTRLAKEAAGFECKHCHTYVSAETIFSGVVNRNHCPYCLWSRHLDLYAAGDRLCACKAPMKPVGLSLKRVYKKYQVEDAGELMLIHRCTDCDHLSINRIAADDIPQVILEVFERSLRLDPDAVAEIEHSGIRLLVESEQGLVLSRLFGRV